MTTSTSRRDTVDRYTEGFRRSDHDMVLTCLTDDVTWHVHGVRTTTGKAESDDEIENLFTFRDDLITQVDSYVVPLR